MFQKWIHEHPGSVGESYGRHLLNAFGFGFAMIGGGLKCLVHGLVPAWWTHAGSDTVGGLHARMAARRTSRNAEAAPHPGGLGGRIHPGARRRVDGR